MRVTLKILQHKIDCINEMTGSPVDPYTRTNDGVRANIGNYHLSQAYGGVCLCRMAEGGGVSMPTSSGHITKKELNHQLDGFLAALRSLE